MHTSARFVSNSKVLHFLFPDFFIPIDGNTLNFFYGNTGESVNKYLEILEFSMQLIKDIDIECDLLRGLNGWYTTRPKIIDNAVNLATRSH